MTEIADLAADYIAVWNEPDDAARLARVARLWTVDGRHRTRVHDITGHDAIAARIAIAHQANIVERGASFVANGVPQRLDDIVKLRWDMVGADGRVAATGLDVLTLDAHDRVMLDLQFIEA